MAKKFLFLALFLLAYLQFTHAVFAGTTNLVSVSSSGSQGNNHSFSPTISKDGKTIVFSSWASNLALPDSSGNMDVFIRNINTTTTDLISKSSTGIPGNLNSFAYLPSISSDKRFIVFHSDSTNLVSNNDTNNLNDVFLHDNATGLTTLISASSDGSAGNQESSFPSISSNGQYITFGSWANNLVANDNNGLQDVYIYDRQTNTMELISISSNSTQANDCSSSPTISADGRFVQFISWANNLVPNDTNGQPDVFVRDRSTGTTILVNVASDGTPGNDASDNGIISADGRFVAFRSYANNLVSNDFNGKADVFVHDLVTGATERVSVSSSGNEGNGDSEWPSISDDGRFVAFQTYANNLVLNDVGAMDVLIHDRVAHTTDKVSVTFDGQPNYQDSYFPSVSSNGRYVAFSSGASNIVQGDTNYAEDIFVRDRANDNDSDNYVVYLDIQNDDCNDNDASVHPGASDVKHDGIDQDCNGYDLTIDITTATYKSSQDKLTVEATSALGAAANLQLVGYGPMTYSSQQSKWTIIVQPANGNPGTVTVSGIEGSETSTVR